MSQRLGERRERERELRALDKIAAALSLPHLERAMSAIQMREPGEDKEAEHREENLGKEIERQKRTLGIPK